MSSFTGFPDETFAFLDGVAAHNEKAWFDAHRPLYEAGYVAPGRAFVEAMGPKLQTLSPGVKFEPRVNGSLSRINRDTRFSKDKRPYKDHLDLWFWHGDKRGWDCPGFWFRLARDRVHMGTGMHAMQKEHLDSFRNSVVHPRSGRALLEAVAAVRKNGDYVIGERTRKLMPRGFATEPDRAEYLLYEGLTAGISLPAAAARRADFLDVAFGHFAATWPIAKWLLSEVG